MNYSTIDTHAIENVALVLNYCH